ncbi:proprotein convertase P-domain-containing protein [Roseimaritima ulvae]|uniref:proprotein convertase P-domain-containing protein n=1 Tax=Roseimaritima ulvae TaxID=980254 RepID=UPI001FD03943|nr:proprotein convertase P-domain-containing protein [Roseimaritima ulvae]
MGLLLFGLHLFGLLPASPAVAQSGLRESLERLDRNDNGTIEPEEITPLSRPYLERIGRAKKLSLNRPNEVEEWQEAARLYHALNNGVSGRRVVPELESSVKSFGPDPDRPLVPEFGLPEVKYPYIQDDLDEAEQTLRRYDRNRDGFIDRAEARRAKWTHRDPFTEDYDGDNRLSRMELGQRYARRRLLDDAADELIQKRRRTGSEVRPSENRADGRDDRRWWRDRSNRYVLTAMVLGRFDSNRNGRLEADETRDIGVPVARIDTDRDGELSRDELHDFLTEMQEAAGDAAEGLPDWFFEQDTNQDKQIAMSEFATVWTEEKVAEFAMLDRNGDGLLTAAEAMMSNAVAGGTFRNDNAEVLPPRRTIISEIVVEDNFRIADLNVQLSITHSHVSMLDAYLIGPDGQRIELFTNVGGTDDHFDGTIFDDQATYPITRAKPPFKGSFLPEGRLKNQPSLTHFNEQNIQGVWQLIISGSRNERFGMLHSWALIAKPMEEFEAEQEYEAEADAADENAAELPDAG